ncbi:MAG: methyltransferase family protein [Promethearchaeota archaeon]
MVYCVSKCVITTSSTRLFFKTENFIFLATLLLTYGIGIIDTIIRPFSESIQEDATINPLYSLIMIVIFLLHPVIVAVSFYESKYLISEYLPLWRNLFVSLFGIFILMVGGFITISGRYQLKNFGEGILDIKEDHQLITTGIYKYIRHQIYGGGIIGIIGFYCAFQSIVVLIIMINVYFFVFRHRLMFEEQLLIEAFGDQYKEYMKQTKCLIPFLY